MGRRAFRLRIGHALSIHGDGFDVLLLQRPVVAVGLSACDRVHHVHTVGHFAEGGILAVEKMRASWCMIKN